MKLPAFGSLPQVDRTLLRRSVITCLVVGTALTVVNHGTDLLHGDFRIESSWQIAITGKRTIGSTVKPTCRPSA